MSKNIKGITIEIGGNTQKLTKALEDVNKKSRDIQSELKQVERLLKLDPKNTELLTQKQKLLAEAVGNSKEKLDRLKAAQAEVAAQFAKGEIGEEQYRAFQREVVKAEQELDKFEKQLKETGMTAEKLGKSMQDAGSKMTGIGKTLSMTVTAPLTAAGAASFKFAADLEDTMGASEQIFKDASGSIKNWADSLASYYGIAESEALTYANTMGAMLQNIGGLSEAEAAKMSGTLVELAGDLTAMFGGTTESAIQALTGALKGNNTMLDNYGMGVNDATIKTKALEMGLYSGKGQMDLATKQAATLALIMEQTADAQGQAAREAEGASGSMRSLQTELKNISTDIGEVLLPILTPFIASLKEIVQSFSQMSPEAKKTAVVIAAIAAAIGPVLIVLGALTSAIGSIITFFAAGGAAATAFGAVITVLTGPVGLVIAAIAALVAVGVLLYKNWDDIKAFGLRLWDDLAKGWTDGIAAIGKAWSDFSINIKATWENMWNDIIAFFETTRINLTGATGKLTDFMLDKWEKFKTGLIAIWSAITGAIKGFINNQLRFINKLIDALNSIKVEIPEWVPGFGGQSFGINLSHVPLLATGTNYVPKDMLAYLHKGEAVVPKEYNNPAPSIGQINIYSNNADEVWTKLERELRRRGVVF